MPGKLNFCEKNAACDYSNQKLEKLVNDFSAHSSMPHCFFNDLADEKVVIGEIVGKSIDLFVSAQAFYQSADPNQQHVHTSFANLCHQLPVDRPMNFISSLASLELEPSEARKLIEQTLFNQKARLDCNSEDIEIPFGESMIFSSPDPDLSDAFLRHLAEVLQPLAQVEEVYAFETSCQNKKDPASLVIGMVMAKNTAAGDFDKITLLACNGIEEFISDREVIDFVEIKDEELLEIARSVSPEIRLER